jgi:hypothetical protein
MKQRHDAGASQCIRTHHIQDVVVSREVTPELIIIETKSHQTAIAGHHVRLWNGTRKLIVI